MARVIRNCWVYKPLHQYRYLPRPQVNPPFDYEEAEATPAHFPDRLPEAPKLWVAWLYKESTESRLFPCLTLLFGERDEKTRTWPLGKMRVFKNTAEWNKLLWRVKHLIEIRPLTFPQGEPTAADVGHVEVLPDGSCRVEKKLETPLEQLEGGAADPRDFTPSQIGSHNARKWHQFKELHEDAVWTDPRHGRIN